MNNQIINFDQHFLNSSSNAISILKEEISKLNISSKIVLEIGGGKGVLTQEIIKFKPKKFICVEIDPSLIPILNPLFIKNKNYELTNSNSITYLQALQPNNHNIDLVIGNIPYSITQGLYVQLLFLQPKEVLFLQSHKTSRTLVEKKTKFSYLLNSLYIIEIISVILGDEFIPKANTLSSIIKFTLKKESEKSLFEQFLTHLTKRYNQQFNNAVIYSLAHVLQIGKKEIKIKINDSSIYLPTEKLSVISNEEFIKNIETIKERFFK